MNGSEFDLVTKAIAILFPLTAGLLVFQQNPYHALVIRGILGAIAALLYAVLGAADVALTEALVGTMLSITLYAVAVRSSMSMKLGVLAVCTDTVNLTQQLNPAIQKVLGQYHLRLEPVVFSDRNVLEEAFLAKEVHCILQVDEVKQIKTLQTRLPRLYDLFKTSALTDLVNLELRQIEPGKTAAAISSQAPLENQS